MVKAMQERLKLMKEEDERLKQEEEDRILKEEEDERIKKEQVLYQLYFILNINESIIIPLLRILPKKKKRSELKPRRRKP